MLRKRNLRYISSVQIKIKFHPFRLRLKRVIEIVRNSNNSKGGWFSRSQENKNMSTERAVFF